MAKCPRGSVFSEQDAAAVQSVTTSDGCKEGCPDRLCPDSEGLSAELTPDSRFGSSVSESLLNDSASASLVGVSGADSDTVTSGDDSCGSTSVPLADTSSDSGDDADTLLSNHFTAACSVDSSADTAVVDASSAAAEHASIAASPAENVSIAADDASPVEDVPSAAAFIATDGASIAAAADFPSSDGSGLTFSSMQANDPELERLRSLLFSEEFKRLSRLEQSLQDKDHNIKQVSNVIAEAVLLRAQKDERLNAALEPVIESVLTSSLRRQHGELVSALFPLMGPSIRRSIAESFRSMLGNFSKSLEMAVSWRGLRWRLEALTSGRRFSEVVMLHTVLYRVEQVFLVHTETGLVLQHLQNEGVGAMDADMVSAMLTAIQDFAVDCFSSGADSLQSLQMGEFIVLLEKGQKAYIACVVRGTPPASFSTDMRFALEMISVQFAEQLQSFDGDTAAFSGAARHLEELLVSRFQEEQSIPLWAKMLPICLLCCIIAGGSWFFYKRHTSIEAQRIFETSMASAADLLWKEPGILMRYITPSEEAPWELGIMRDPLARTPDEILQQSPVPKENFVINEVPYVSYDTEIVKRRIVQSLQPPEGVTLSLSADGKLTLEGAASLDWIGEAQDKAYSLPGVNAVDSTGVLDPRLKEMSDLKKYIESNSVEFPLGSSTPSEKEMARLKQIVDSIVKLEQLAKDTGLLLSLTIYGHADPSGSAKRNYEISEARTRLVAALLYEKGSSVPVSMYGMGASYPKQTTNDAQQADKSSRRIEMHVHLMRIAQTDSRLFAE